MTLTYLSTRQSQRLLALYWRGLDVSWKHWEKLQTLLEVLHREYAVLGDCSGELRVAILTGDTPVGMTWPIHADADGVLDVQARLRGAPETAHPYALELRAHPVVLLEDDFVEVVACDKADLEELGRIPLTRVEEIPAPSGFVPWRMLGGPELNKGESLLRLSAMFGRDGQGPEMVLGVYTYMDVWLSEHLIEGDPTGPHARASAQLLVECFGRIAAETGATVRLEEIDPQFRT
jgi:hypothetical protein